MKKEGTVKMKKMPKMENVDAAMESAPSHMTPNDAAICKAVFQTLNTIDTVVEDANDIAICVGAINNKLSSENFDDPNVKSMLLSAINKYMADMVNDMSEYASPETSKPDKVYNPTTQKVFPSMMTDWIVMQTINMYAWLGMPCVVSGRYNSEIVIKTNNITYDYVVRLAEDSRIDFAYFTDGNRVTTLKR